MLRVGIGSRQDGPPDGKRGAGPAEPAPQQSPATKQSTGRDSLPQRSDDAAEAAEHRCFEYHQVDQHTADCLPCPWCEGWAA